MTEPVSRGGSRSASRPKHARVTTATIPMAMPSVMLSQLSRKPYPNTASRPRLTATETRMRTNGRQSEPEVRGDATPPCFSPR